MDEGRRRRDKEKVLQEIRTPFLAPFFFRKVCAFVIRLLMIASIFQASSIFMLV